MTRIVTRSGGEIRESKEHESQNRIDSIIALMMEEAKTVKHIKGEAARIYHVHLKVRERVVKIMRTME